MMSEQRTVTFYCPADPVSVPWDGLEHYFEELQSFVLAKCSRFPDAVPLQQAEAAFYNFEREYFSRQTEMASIHLDMLMAQPERLASFIAKFTK